MVLCHCCFAKVYVVFCLTAWKKSSGCLLSSGFLLTELTSDIWSPLLKQKQNISFLCALFNIYTHPSTPTPPQSPPHTHTSFLVGTTKLLMSLEGYKMESRCTLLQDFLSHTLHIVGEDMKHAQ